MYHSTRVKLRLFRVYIESLTMSSQEPREKEIQTRSQTILFVQQMHMRGFHVFYASTHQRAPYGKKQEP